MVEVTILSRQDCHLCVVVMKMARRIQVEIPFSLIHTDLDRDPELAAQYGDRVPVVLIDQVERFWGSVKEQDLRRAIKRARWRTSISRILSRMGLRPTRG